MALIEIKNASFAYEENTILHRLDLTVEQGELCCLMGPNGCGKSTLLDCILGDLHLQDGEIFVDGQSVLSYKQQLLAQKIAYVPQIHDRSFPYTVEEIVLMGRTAYSGYFGSPGKDEEKMVRNALAIAGIGHLAARPYTQISGGEMQLVMLARALVQDTPIIIMDEPTAHLDFKNEMVFMQTVVSLIKNNNVGVLMATHSPNQPFYFENKGIEVKVAAMKDGHIFCQGNPSQVLTEASIKEIYQIESKRLTYADARIGQLCQIVPLGTCD